MSELQLQTKIKFNDEWLLSRRDDPVYPVNKVRQLIEASFNVINMETLVSELNFVVVGCDISSIDDNEKLESEISKLINDEYGLTADGDKYTIDVLVFLDYDDYISDIADEAEKSQKVPNVPKSEFTERGRKTLDEINALVGAEEFKELANEIFKAAGGLRKNKLTDVFAERAYIISIDKGCGLTHYLNLFAELVDALGLVKLIKGQNVLEKKINVPAERDDITNFGANLDKMFGTCPGSCIICLDISEWLGKLSDPNFSTLLRAVEKQRGKHIFFFGVPFIEKDVLKDVELAVNDILCVRTLSIAPFTEEHILRFAENILSEKGFTLESDAWDMFNTRIAIEKNDGKFYGINTVRKVVFELLYLKQVSNAERGVDNTTVSADDIKTLADGMLSDERTGLEQLEDLVGADDLKKQILEIVSQIEYSRRVDSVKPPCIHMRFVGNPGTGKTTIARLLGKILKEKGILRKGDFFEVFSRDLCGQYVGATAPKTAAKCRDAYGSVLFIDEAYALYNPESGRDYGREAIETLIAQMENHRSDLVVIMAGYPDKMETLMECNQGLRSRMPYVIKFPNYTRNQLAGIFMKMAEGTEHNEEFSTAVEEFFNNLSDDMLNSQEFSNARFVRNLYERTWGKAVLRCQIEGGDPNTLTAEDFVAASADNEFVNSPERKRHRVGF